MKITIPSRMTSFMAARDRMLTAKQQLAIAFAAGLQSKVMALRAELREATGDYHAYLL